MKPELGADGSDLSGFPEVGGPFVAVARNPVPEWHSPQAGVAVVRSTPLLLRRSSLWRQPTAAVLPRMYRGPGLVTPRQCAAAIYVHRCSYIRQRGALHSGSYR